MVSEHDFYCHKDGSPKDPNEWIVDGVLYLSYEEYIAIIREDESND